MIAIGEATASKRRIKIAIYVEDGSALALDAAAGLSAGDVQVSKNGAAFANAAGTLAHIADGHYYYEAASSEVSTVGFLLVKYERAGYKKEGWYDYVGTMFTTGETVGVSIRLPIAIYNDDSPPALTTGATATGAELQVSVNGAAFANATGTLVEIGDGFYYYQAVSADVSTSGWILVKYEKTGFQTLAAFTSIEDSTSSGAPSPFLDDFTTPGDLADDPTEARWTPVHLEFEADEGFNVVVQVQIGEDSALWMAVYDEKLSGTTGQDAYSPLFRSRSTISIDGDFGDLRTFEMDIIPNGGWQRPDIAIVPYVAVEIS